MPTPKALGRTLVGFCCLASLVGCGGRTGAKPPPGAGTQGGAIPALSEILEARISRDGSSVAVLGLPASGRGGKLQRVWLFDAATTTVVAASPDQYESRLPYFGPGGSYLVALGHRRGLVGEEWELWYSPDLRTPPRSLAGPGRETLRSPTPLWDSQFAPDGKAATIVERTADRGSGTSLTQVFALPLDRNAPVSGMASVRTEGWITPLGVYDVPSPQKNRIALFAGGPWPLRTQPGIIALTFPGGSILWDRPFAPETGWFNDACLYDPQTLLVLEETEDEKSIIYAVNLGTGNSSVFAKVPEACRWISVFPSPPKGKLLLCGDYNVWSIGVTDGVAGKPEKVIQGPASLRTRTAGARYDAQHGPEVYAWSWHVLWRCRLSDGTVQPALGTPQTEGDEAPSIVGRHQD